MTLLTTVNKNLASCIAGEEAGLCSLISKVIMRDIVISIVTVPKKEI